MFARLFASRTRHAHEGAQPSRFAAGRRALLLGGMGGLLAMVSAPHAAASEKSGKPWLGVSMSRPSGGGVQVEHVFRASPAEKAKLKKRDLITHADGVQLDAPSDLVRHVSKHEPGMTIKLTVRRGGKDQVMPVTLAEHPGAEHLSRLMHVGQEAYELQGLENIQGATPSSIRALRGKVVLLDFFAGWCKNCRAMTPELARLEQKYRAEGLVVLGITSDEPDVARDVAKKWNIPYTVASDESKATFSAYSVTAIPDVFVVDKKGVIREVIVGYDPAQRAQMEKLIKELLAE